MEFTLEDKLSFILGQPFADGRTLLEADDETKPDRRLKVTTQWQSRVNAVKMICRLRDRAKAVGLDGEFAAIVKHIVPTGIKSTEDLTYRRAREISLALLQADFEDRIAEREHESLQTIDADDPKTKAAYELLKQNVPSGTSELSTTLKGLINPNEHDASKPLKVHYYNDNDFKAPQVLVLDNGDSVIDQFKKLSLAIQNSGQKHLFKKLMPLYKARITILSRYMPDASEAQVKYTAAFYTIRNIALEFMALEHERHDEYQENKRAKAKSEPEPEPTPDSELPPLASLRPDEVGGLTDITPESREWHALTIDQRLGQLASLKD